MQNNQIIKQFVTHITDMSIEYDEEIQYVLDILSLDLELTEKMNNLFNSGVVLVIEYNDINNDYNKREINSTIMMLYVLNKNNKLLKISTIETIIDHT